MKKNIRHDVIAWNNRFPLDRWYREKHNIPYLSKDHRESTFYGQYFEYYEDLVYKEVIESKMKDKLEKKEYTPNVGDWWKGKVSGGKEVDDWFDSPL